MGLRGLVGPDFYDDEAVFVKYAEKRAHPDSANETLEKPVFDELAGDLTGLRILDLGCGDAHFGQEALQSGCLSYVGIEGSKKMYELARARLVDTTGQVVHAKIEDWSSPPEQFDLVTARLVLHYIEDIVSVFAGVYQALSRGRRFIFSVEHPVVTSCDRAWTSTGVRQDWIVDDYFRSGRRVTSWMGRRVVKYHRTIEDYFCALRQTGFIVDAVRESRPRRAAITDEDTFRRRQRMPLMLFFSATRPD